MGKGWVGTKTGSQAVDLLMGAEVMDLVTGFKGKVTALHLTISGRVDGLVQPRSPGGWFDSPQWFEAERLEKVGRKVEKGD